MMMICRFVSRSPWSRRFFSSDADRRLANAISEIHKEMESVFGEPPASGLAGSAENHSVTLNFNDSQIRSEGCTENKLVSGLTHIGSQGEAQMVDVSLKEITKRVAVASCKVILGREVFDLVASEQMKKGDVLSVAKMAGICGAKQTSNLIPLCHNINLTHIRVDLSLNPQDFSVDIEGEAASTGKTGVEMEAMTAATVAGLTVYDMCKAVSKHIQITNVQLEHKAGGKSGDWRRKNR
ncbi:cyclic pyranopterin monophosphate synthase, mitochondrial isoform X2 [Coffea arabica]|nr:cyclic pyranopterin monophosphate synthase, mitochondrial isoform X2 [Coffea arabica]XP_027087527.1 cyclic pyranopterin monophosphate synthase, mitochondrial isoform X2 [Coffea arabica]